LRLHASAGVEGKFYREKSPNPGPIPVEKTYLDIYMINYNINRPYTDQLLTIASPALRQRSNRRQTNGAFNIDDPARQKVPLLLIHFGND
jgi:hypothetical protein